MAEDIKKMPVGAGLPEMPEEIVIAPKKEATDWKRIFFILLGLALFFLFYFMSDLPDAVDPAGKHFPLPPQGRMALGLFLMAAVWWIFEVMPIGATAIAIGLFQVIFTIRTADQALKDFFDPSVWVIVGRWSWAWPSQSPASPSAWPTRCSTSWAKIPISSSWAPFSSSPA